MSRFDERGSIGGVEGLAFGVLLFVFGTLVFTTAWGVVDAKLATSAAAREAARAYVEAENETAAVDDARSAAGAAMTGYGRPVSAVDITGGFERCGSVSVAVVTEVPRVALPLIGRPAGKYVITTSHREVVDPYRSGPDGTASCQS